MGLVVALAAIGLLFAVGLFHVLAKDRLWAMHSLFRRAEGLRTERTREWDVSQSVVGLVLMAGAVVSTVLLAHVGLNAPRVVSASGCGAGPQASLACGSYLSCVQSGNPRGMCEELFKIYAQMPEMRAAQPN